MLPQTINQETLAGKYTTSKQYIYEHDNQKWTSIKDRMGLCESKSPGRLEQAETLKQP